MNNYKKILSVLLAIALIVSNNLTAFAQEVKSTEKKAFKFISVDDVSDIRYTYEENGSKYMVKEHANKELTEVTTDIYELNGKKILLKDHYVTNIFFHTL